MNLITIICNCPTGAIGQRTRLLIWGFWVQVPGRANKFYPGDTIEMDNRRLLCKNCFVNYNNELSKKSTIAQLLERYYDVDDG